MVELYFAMPIKCFNHKDRELNEKNIIKYANMVDKLQEQYEGRFKLHHDIEIMELQEPIESIAISLILSMGATSHDGLLLPSNYKEYGDCVALRDVAVKDGVDIYILNEKYMIITKEGEKNKYESSKVTTDSCCKCTDSVTCSTNYNSNKKIQSDARTTILSDDTKRVAETRVYKIIDGDAEVTFEEGNGERKITIDHNGSKSEYRL